MSKEKTPNSTSVFALPPDALPLGALGSLTAVLILLFLLSTIVTACPYTLRSEHKDSKGPESGGGSTPKVNIGKDNLLSVLEHNPPIEATTIHHANDSVITLFRSLAAQASRKQSANTLLASEPLRLDDDLAFAGA